MSNEVGNTIFRQLGGRRFAIVTGSKNFVTSDNSLTFKLVLKTSNKANYIRITLNHNDLYDVEFISIRGPVINQKGLVNDVYCDSLVDIIESNTGILCRL